MVERKVIVDKVSTFVEEKLNEVLDSNPFSFIIKPYVSRVANNYIGKLDGLLKAIEDKDGKVDIEGILSESIDNLVVAQVKKYPNVFSGVEIGGGTIKINIPSFDAAPIPEKYDNGIDMAIAHGHDITRIVNPL